METKNNFAMVILSSIICALPLILSLVVYNDLPEQIVIQWNVEGNPNRFAPRAFAAFGLPLLFVIINIFSKMFLYNDPRQANVSKVMRTLREWLVPFLSLTVVPIILFSATGATIPLFTIGMVFVGLVLIVYGNYLPKSRQNYTVGIKLPWTLNDTDNWNKTHRLAGHLWILGGMVFIIISFLSPGTFFSLMLILSILVLLLIMPVLYSFIYFNRNKKTRQVI